MLQQELGKCVMQCSVCALVARKSRHACVFRICYTGVIWSEPNLAINVSAEVICTYRYLVLVCRCT